MKMLLNKSDIRDFQTDGVVLLRGIFKDWIDLLNKGADFHISNPSKSALIHKHEGSSGEFIEDFCNWERIKEYKDFVESSSLGSIAGQLMKSKSVQFFHDHFFYKEASSGVATPWHQDMPYYCVSGLQTVSFWIPLESRAQKVSLKCASGSHNLPKEIRPTSWADNESFYDDNDAFMNMPNLDNGDFDIKQWATEPGDVIAFNFKTIHGANANMLPGTSKTLSFRLVGDDVVYRKRPGRTSPNFPDIGQENGERLREDWFPTIWRK